MTAYHVIYRGHVQGVGFRFTVIHFARAYDHVTGWVKNAPDGTVEMHLEGPSYEVESLLEDIATGPHMAYIREVTAEPVPPAGDYSRFSIEF